MVVVTTASPASAPRARRSSAQIARIWSPSTGVPVASTARARSPSPSKARPRSAPTPRTTSPTSARSVEPQPSLMLIPSGSTPTRVTRAPRRSKISGAVTAVAPLAQSRTTVIPERSTGQRRSTDSTYSVRPPSQAVIAPSRSPSGRDPSASRSASTAASAASASLKPSAPKSLMPLSAKGLCEALITAPAAASDPATSSATAGVGMIAEQHGVGARAGEAGGERALEHRPAATGVAADHHPRSRRQAAPERAPDGERELGCQLTIGNAPDAVRSEQLPRRR